VKVDMLVEGTDMPPTMTYRQAARKAVAACVSDFAAKGVRPRTFLVSLGLKKGTTEAQVRQLGNGLRDAEKEWGLGLIGGDTNESKELTIDCAMLGFGKRVVGRKGASPGDLLVVTGRFGLQPSGLRILTKGARADRAFRARATESVLRPTPHLAGGLALSTYLTSSMDSSDGLARSLHTLAGTSGVGFEVDCLPLARGVASFAGKNHLSTEDLALAGGEEYVIVGTIRGSNASEAIEVVRKAGTELLVIGRATARKGVVVLRSKGTKKPIPDEGWTHLA
jgi:thiamine-monophosphate kinase